MKLMSFDVIYSAITGTEVFRGSERKSFFFIFSSVIISENWDEKWRCEVVVCCMDIEEIEG